MPTGGKLRAKAVIIVGIGDPAELTADGLRRAGAGHRAAGHEGGVGGDHARRPPPPELDAADAAQAVAEGLVLGAYQFLEYKRDPSPTQLRKVTLVGCRGAGVKAALDRASAIADAVCWARDLVNTPSKEKSPADVVAETRSLMRGRGVNVQVFDVAQLRQKRMGGVLGVGQGSAQTPRFLRLTYSPTGARGKALALVGKGVVFDSGGLSLKPAGGMETMKCDMSGAAAVIGAMSALKQLGVKTKVVGYVPLVENMPSGTAIRPGDVLRIRNGKTVEVLNTDAEGRLILADALDARVGGQARRDRRPRHAHRRVRGRARRQDRRPHGQRRGVGRAGRSRPPSGSASASGRSRCRPTTGVASTRRSPTSRTSARARAARSPPGCSCRSSSTVRRGCTSTSPGPRSSSGDDGYIPKGGTGFGVRTLLELAEHLRGAQR